MSTKKDGKFSAFQPTMLGEQPASLKAKTEESTPAPKPEQPSRKRKVIAPEKPKKVGLVSASFRVSADILQDFDDLAYELRHRSKRELFDEALCDLIAKYREAETD